MAELRGVNLLQNELERAKESLKDVDENIKKLTGRDPTIQRPQRRVSLGSSESPRGGKSAGAERIFSLARRGIQIVPDNDGPRRRMGGAFSRLGPRPGGHDRGGRGQDSGDEEDSRHRPAVQSSVIATPKEDRSRQNSIEEQARDRKGQARNRRMFGLLLGTLQKFKDESKETKDKEEQRIKIEKKLEEKFKQEKEEIIKERRQLYLERRKKQFRIRLIEQKMEMAQNHENWAVESRKLENFICTKAKPHLFYMPKILTPETESKLKDSKKAVDAMIEEHRMKLEEEIEHMMSQVHDFRGDEDDDDGDDASMGEEDKGSDEEGNSDGEGEHRDDKENRDRMKSEIDEEFLTERELRDREREQRDRDRRLKDARREERGRKREERGERKKDDSRDRGKVGTDRSKEREKDKSHARHRERTRSRSRSREHSRDRHRSGKSRPEKKGRHHSESEKHSSKPKRRSKGDGKNEKKEKVWEPMEDEEEEEFVGSKDNGEKDLNIQSKMLDMAGMGDIVKERDGKNENDERENDKAKYLESHGIQMSNSDRPTEEPETGNKESDSLQEVSGKANKDQASESNAT